MSAHKKVKDYYKKKHDKRENSALTMFVQIEMERLNVKGLSNCPMTA